MKIIIVKDYEAMSEAAAKEVIMALQTNAKLKLGLATGGTPEGLYKQLIAESINGRLEWKDVQTFNLDEYVGLDSYHPLSYHTYMNEKFFSKVNLKKRHTHLPKGTGNSDRNIAKYQKALDKAGGIDLQILGIGENAHIAFNEPGASKDDGIRVVELTPETIRANARYFANESEVPRQAITMGVGTILKAKKIVLIANGERKAQAIKDTVEGPITGEVPASFLQLHNDVTLIIDESAASGLKKVELPPQPLISSTKAPKAKAKPATTKAKISAKKPLKVSLAIASEPSKSNKPKTPATKAITSKAKTPVNKAKATPSAKAIAKPKVITKPAAQPVSKSKTSPVKAISKTKPKAATKK